MRRKAVVKIISKKRPWYSRLVAAILFSLILYLTVIFYIKYDFSFTEEYYKKGIKTLAIIIVLIAYGIKFSYTVNHHFDFELNRYREFWAVGVFGRGKWLPMKKLERVSTFLNNRGYCEVNIWDVKNNKYRITAFEKIDDAVVFGRNLAINLDLKFLERN